MPKQCVSPSTQSIHNSRRQGRPYRNAGKGGLSLQWLAASNLPLFKGNGAPNLPCKTPTDVQSSDSADFCVANDLRQEAGGIAEALLRQVAPVVGCADCWCLDSLLDRSETGFGQAGARGVHSPVG